MTLNPLSTLSVVVFLCWDQHHGFVLVDAWLEANWVVLKPLAGIMDTAVAKAYITMYGLIIICPITMETVIMLILGLADHYDVL